MVAVAAAVVACAAGVLVTVVLRSGATPPLAPPASLPTATTMPTTPTDVPTTTPEQVYPTPLETADAVQRLAAQVDNDRGTVEPMVGYWVPQVSSKALGTLVAGRALGYDDIEQNYLDWAARFPSAVLLRSDDYSTFSAAGYWVTVIPTPSSTAEQANAWCDAQGLPSDDCFAKGLSHTETPAGKTVHRR